MALSICYQALDDEPLKNFSVGLSILDKAGLLGILTPKLACNIFCDLALGKVTAEDITAENITAAAIDSFKVLIESISPDNLLLELQDKVKGKLQEEPCINQKFLQQCFDMLELKSINNLGRRTTEMLSTDSNQEIAVESQLSRG